MTGEQPQSVTMKITMSEREFMAELLANMQDSSQD